MKTASLYNLTVRILKTFHLKLFIDTGQMFTVPSIHRRTEWKEDLQRFKISKLFLQFISTEPARDKEGAQQLMCFCTVLTKLSRVLFRFSNYICNLILIVGTNCKWFVCSVKRRESQI